MYLPPLQLLYQKIMAIFLLCQAQVLLGYAAGQKSETNQKVTIIIIMFYLHI